MTLDLFLVGLAITLEPLPLSAYLLLLSSENGTRKGLGFVLGWVLTLVALVVLTLAITGGQPLTSGSTPSTAVLVAKILLGVVLLVFAWRTRARRDGPAPPPPRWKTGIDRIGFVPSMGLGFLLQPWPLVAAGIASITAANLSQATTVLTLAAFCLLASAGYLAIQVYAAASPVTARARLDALNAWIVTHRDGIAVVAAVAIGLYLIGKSAYLLLA